MTTWAERMHRRAATFGNVVTSCGHPSVPYPRRLEKAFPHRPGSNNPGLEFYIRCQDFCDFPQRENHLSCEKLAAKSKIVYVPGNREIGIHRVRKWAVGHTEVKFGIPLDEVCKNDIPGPLLVLVLKLNKEAPLKKDVFRAPGHQGNMKKLIHFLQTGRLVNIDNFSVYTIASVLKKFLRKLPGGIFGRTNEQQLFTIVQMNNITEQRDEIYKLISSLPGHTQRLLVLLFGTFRVIATNAERAQTGMTSEALGVSVAPSFFQSCVSDGKTAKMEDVLRYKVATRIMKFLIDNFGAWNLFGRTNYEFYARITGRIIKVEDEWIFSFRFPPDNAGRHVALETEKTWLQYECERWGLKFNLETMSHQEESQSTPALIHVPEALDAAMGTSLSMIPENNLLESCTRLSISLEENGLFKGSSRSSSSSASHHMTLDELRAVNRYAESTKSLSYLPQVHERQAARMRTRSEWFLNPPGRLGYSMDSDPTSLNVLRGSNNLGSASNIGAGAGLSASAESVSKRPSVKRTSSRSRYNRGSRRNKENGNKPLTRPPLEPDTTQTIHVTVTYKPRI